MIMFGYCRVSTHEQALEGHSIEAQRTRILAYCMAHGIPDVEIVEDAGVSGTTPPDDRPGMARALKALDAGTAVGLVAVRLDRWSRSALDMLTIADRAYRHGWALHSVTEHLDTSIPMGRFVLTILAAVAQLERDMIRDRTRETMTSMTEAGAHFGTVPYGYRRADVDRRICRDGCTCTPAEHGPLTHLVTDEVESSVVDAVIRLSEGGATQIRIARELRNAGIPTRSGRPWHRRTIQSILSHVARGQRLSSLP